MNEFNNILLEEFGGSYLLNTITRKEAILNSITNSSISIMIGWTNLGLSISLDSVIGLKYFEEVESVMTNVIKESGLQTNYFGGKQNTINIFERIEKNEIRRDEKSDFRLGIQRIRKTVQDKIETKLACLDSIQDLALYVNGLNEVQLSEFLTNPTLIRKLAINKLANNTYKIEDEVEKIKKQYQDAENNYPNIFKNYNKAIEIYSELIESS